MHLLVLRFSSMGDVALTVPVITSLVYHYPDIRITFVTKKEHEPFFYNIPGLEFIGVDLENKYYRGIRGMYRLYRELQLLGPYDYGIDLHDSLRTKLLKLFFFGKLPFATIIKGRREKHKQTRRKNKELYPLPHTVERYLRVFERIGLSPRLVSGPYISLDLYARKLAKDFLTRNGITRKENIWIGIAPFAGHVPKTWPFERTKRLIQLIEDNLNARIFLFGGGEKEITLLSEVHKEHPHSTVLVAGKLSLEGEMALIDRLHVMIAMDSFNMHIASLIGIPVISIWGATHPYSGFSPFGQKSDNIIQIPTEILPCRPCSVFGNKKCFRKDLACLNSIEPEDVFRQLCYVLNIPVPDHIREKKTILSEYYEQKQLFIMQTNKDKDNDSKNH